jgi:hypothetical protein
MNQLEQKDLSGLYTSSETRRKLKISASTLKNLVEKGIIEKVVPYGYQNGYYTQKSVNEYYERQQIFQESYSTSDKSKGQEKGKETKAKRTIDLAPEKLPTTFSEAAAEDMAEIVDIDIRTFHVAITEETYLRWFQKNPASFRVLRDASNHVAGYAALVPLKKEIIERFIRDEISMDDITADDVDLFESGKPLHVYVFAVCVDPIYRGGIKEEYGARIVRGMFDFFLELAKRGVDIETITARNDKDKPDGRRLLQKLGIPQLRSPVPDKYLFSVHVADSGYPMLAKYSDMLAEWKQNHATKQ